jgi:hypothetical protein
VSREVRSSIVDGGPLFGRQPFWLKQLARLVECDPIVWNERAGMLDRTVRVVGGWGKAIWCWSLVVDYTERCLADLAESRQSQAAFLAYIHGQMGWIRENAWSWHDYNAQVARWEDDGGCHA